MTKKTLEDVFNNLEDKLHGRELVLQLVSKDATDYERGRMLGQIEMLTKLKRELLPEDKVSK